MPMPRHATSARTRSLQSYLRAALVLAIVIFAINAVADVHGWWWDALRMTVYGLGLGIAVAVVISRLRDRRARRTA